MAELHSRTPSDQLPAGAKMIPGFDDYCIDKTGQVFSRRPIGGPDKNGIRKRKPWKPLKSSLNSHGYPAVAMAYAPWRSLTKEIHVLVMLVFAGPRPEGLEVRHLDGVKTNNRLENLAYGTKSENMEDAIRHGSKIVGETHYLAKLTNAQVLEIRRLRHDGTTPSDIATLFGVTSHYVTKICSRQIWKRI